MDRPDGGVGRIEVRDLLEHGHRDDDIHTLGVEQVNPSDPGQEDER
jgi:hypothetical protein